MLAIGPSMLRTVGDQATLWETILPPEAFGMFPVLAAVDASLDGDRLFHPAQMQATVTVEE